MPSTLSYPGVYIEEVPSGVRAISAVATSITAFVGRAARGPISKAVLVNGFGDFERQFGGLWLKSQLGYAVRDFFLNGGSQAIIVRLHHPSYGSEEDQAVAEDAAAATAAAAVGANAAAAATAAQTEAATYEDEPALSAAAAVAAAAAAAAAVNGATVEQVTAAARVAAAPASAALDVGGLLLVAASPGRWGGNLRVVVDTDDIADEVAAALGVAKSLIFNLTVRDASPGGASERFANLTTVESARRIDRVLAQGSTLLRWRGTLDPDAAPAVTAVMDPVSEAEDDVADAKAAWTAAQIAGSGVDDAKEAYDDAVAALVTARETALQAASDGGHLTAADFLPAGGEADKRGLYALEQADLFNLLCIPPYATSDAVNFDVDDVVLSAATAYCEKRRAVHLIDPPSSWTAKQAVKDAVSAGFPPVRSRNAAVYFPRVRQPNLLRENRLETFAPCGVVAGVIARTDTQRGVWKAPAGLEATMNGVPQLEVNLTDLENGELNPLGINCLRAFPVAGRVVWGARTLRGADQLADEWKYLPVRRTALFIEESLYRGTQWVVFEPNDEPLWAQIRLNVGAFMQGLFRQGAFQGSSPRDAYFVRCDKDTTTQADIDLGIVNIAVGFAPLKPAEFVVIRLQQIAGQTPA
ncbi:phage tail sheath subtilisin-like domain-containing protein [Paucibacter sp. PLA-PC-4]|uniref:phage tail sheath family protein n=1 Tax=Paucibacter sp. PLA-PC-4 TaxID=2993655 RepID=UPI00224AE3B2|nr:phage tail sheath subtilisin-like domain-containing protein [Paucibacter sp. PLA-PC-4]MCX2864877.1 phage tail sheath subtilisin-like domain-containing protein [Paucibacter sp. PLA-PC-4]